MPILLLFSPFGAHAKASFDAKNGRYELESHVDTRNFPPEQREQIPYGALVVKGSSKNKFDFTLEYNTGYPRFHAALAEGTASKSGKRQFHYEEALKYYPSEKCELNFSMKEEGVEIASPTPHACGFGASTDPSGFYRRK